MYIIRRASDGAFYRAPRSPLAHYGTTFDASRATPFSAAVADRICNRMADQGSGHWSKVKA